MTDGRLQDYRQTLQELEQQAQQSYDKTVLTLSGGALGVSFAFVSDIIGSSSALWTAWLVIAWISWGLSVTAVLFSFFFSHLALRKAVDQIDAESIHQERPGGSFDLVTAILNATGGGLFLVGVISMVIFATRNMMR